jgi:integrase
VAVAGYIEDRWLTKRPDPLTKERRRTARYGKGARYRVAGIPGVRDRSFHKKADADTWLADAQSKSKAGEFTDPRRGNMLLRDYVQDEWWPTVTGDPGTLEVVHGRVRKHILPRLGGMPLNTIKLPQLRRWLADLEEDIGPSTIGVTWGNLSAILQAAVEDERIPRNYCKSTSIKPPTVPERKARAWAKTQVLAVREAITDRYRVMVDLGVGAGLRQGEMFGLSVDDIDREAGVIHVRRQIRKVHNRLAFAPPKRGKVRDVPLSSGLDALLTAHMQQFPPKKIRLPWVNPDEPETPRQEKERAPQTHELLLTSPWGKALRRDSWNQRHWKEALVAARVIPEPATRKVPVKGTDKFRTVKTYAESREYGLHALRHTFVSQLLGAGTSIVAVSSYVGHKDPSITLRIYAHMMPESDDRGRAAIDAWFTTDS